MWDNGGKCRVMGREESLAQATEGLLRTAPSAELIPECPRRRAPHWNLDRGLYVLFQLLEVYTTQERNSVYTDSLTSQKLPLLRSQFAKKSHRFF